MAATPSWAAQPPNTTTPGPTGQFAPAAKSMFSSFGSSRNHRECHRNRGASPADNARAPSAAGSMPGNGRHGQPSMDSVDSIAQKSMKDEFCRRKWMKAFTQRGASPRQAERPGAAGRPPFEGGRFKTTAIPAPSSGHAQRPIAGWFSTGQIGTHDSLRGLRQNLRRNHFPLQCGDTAYRAASN